MNFIEKVNRKLKLYYYDKRLQIKKRIIFDESLYYDSISLEENVDYFNKPIFLLSYDDTSMMKKSETTLDYGGNFNGELNKLFFEFIDNYPYLKHTLFFVPNPVFIKEGLTSKTIEKDIYNIDNFSKENEFISKLIKFESEKIIEIALHGYNHVNTKINDYYSAFEFEFLTKEEAKVKIDKGLDSLKKYFKIFGFKPPAWGMGQLSGTYYLTKVLKEYNVDYVCLSSPTNGLNYEKKKVSYIYPEIIDNLFNIPQNISILWDLEYIYKIIDLIVQKKGIINIQLHYTLSHIYLKDGICYDNINKLSKIIEYIKKYDIEYLLHNEVRIKCKK
jgi:hypothetical protein